MTRRLVSIVPFAVVVFALSSPAARAHDISITRMDAVFQPDGTFKIDMEYDADAWLAGIAPGHLMPADRDAYRAKPAAERTKRETELGEYIQRLVKLRFDDVQVPYAVALFETTPLPPKPDEPLNPAHYVRLAGRAPAQARTFVMSSPREFGIVLLGLHNGTEPATIQSIVRGGRSEPFALAPTGLATSAAAPSPPQGALSVSLQFIKIGFQHILPEGLDHIVFVISLFLLSKNLKALLWQVTAFTVAHSITLSLAVLGIVNLSLSARTHVIEPLIALSIAFVAIENLFTSKLHVWRPIVVFLFGLLHGLGFASALMEIGVPDGHYANALASFNVGVELGQVTVILLAFAAVGWWRKSEWYRGRIVIPASCAIALMGLYWSVTRFLGV